MHVHQKSSAKQYTCKHRGGIWKISQYFRFLLRCSHVRGKSFANAGELEKLERLCRYIRRPAISEQRLSMTQHGKVPYELKTPYRDGPGNRIELMYSLPQLISLAN